MSEEASGKAGLLKNRLFMKLYGSFTTSSLGDWFDMLAIQVLVGYRWHASPIMLALIPIAMALPGIILGSVAGAAVDRWSKLRMMRLCDLLTVGFTIAIFFAPNMLWLLPLLMLRASVGTIKAPAQQTLTRSVVSEDQLLQATSLNSIANQGSKIAGPLLGGMALLVLAPQWCILINAFFRICSLLLLVGIKLPSDRTANRNEDVGSNGIAESADSEQSPEKPGQEKPSFGALWREGWVYIAGNTALRNTMLLGFIATLAIQTIDFQFTSLFRYLAPKQESMLGWFVAAAGAGAVLLMLFMVKYNKGGGYGWKMGGGYLLVGCSLVGLGVLQAGATLMQVLPLGVLLGVGNGALMITFNYCLQAESSPEMTGRVFGIQNTILNAVMIGAPPLGGIWAEFAGSSSVFLWIGVVVAVTGLSALVLGRRLWPSRRAAVAASDA
ncbi:MFS transporter [Paenibacillus sp. CAU 1782]